MTACTGDICVCCTVCCVSALLCVLGVPFLGNALLARRGFAPGETAGRSPLVAGAAACARGFSALAYGVLLAAAGVGWPAYVLCILSFLVLHVAVYCDCTARIIPTEATLVLVCCGVCLCMAQEGPPLLLERALLAAPLLGALCLCNFTSRHDPGKLTMPMFAENALFRPVCPRHRHVKSHLLSYLYMRA
jgi:hypothetical protein